MDSLWVFLTLAAGSFQSARNGLARSLSGLVSPALNSWSRFAFNLPFATTLFVFLVLTRGAPELSARFLLLCLGTGVSQLLGNVALVAAFRRIPFAHAILLHKLEIVFTAIVGVTLFSEVPTPTGWAGILVCAVGVVWMQTARSDGPGAADPSIVTASNRAARAGGAVLAIAAGLGLVFASFLLKDAAAELARINPRVGAARFEVASHTLFHVTWMEVVLLSAWIGWRTPREFEKVRTHWRRMALIGATGFAGSLGWFWAYSLTLVAYVKAVGQIEAVVAVLLSLFVWHERQVVRQLPGMATVLAGILLVLLG